MKKILCIIISLIFIFSGTVFVSSADSEDDAVPSEFTSEYAGHFNYAYLCNMENDAVLYEKGDMNLSIYPASTVKIMTGITAIEALNGDYTKTIAVTAEMLDHAAGNKIGFKEGEVLSAEQLLFSMLVNGANDAAIILSYLVGGSIEGFVSMMNDKAFSIGARSTVYANPTGLHDDNMHTTMADTITIAKYAYNIPLFMEMVCTQKYVLDATNMSDYRNIYNRNCLMSKYYRPDYYYDNAMGVNAGSTTQAGYSIVSFARTADCTLTYLAVVMGAESIENPDDPVNDTLVNYCVATELFEWAMAAFGYREVLSDKNVIAEIPVSLSSTADYVTLVPKESITVFIPENVDIDKEITITTALDEDVSAPIAKGQKLGIAKVLYDNRELGKVDLIATADVDRSEFLFALSRIGDFTSGRFFIFTIIAAAVLTAVYILLKSRMRQRKLRFRVPDSRRK